MYSGSRRILIQEAVSDAVQSTCGLSPRLWSGGRPAACLLDTHFASVGRQQIWPGCCRTLLCALSPG
eukprot:2005475-Amphidinium_carterae.1